MSEETVGEVWEREQREGVPIRKALRQAVHDYRILVLVWAMVPVGMMVLPVLPWMFWVGGALLLTGSRIYEVGKSRRHFNEMMNIVRSLPREDPE